MSRADRATCECSYDDMKVDNGCLPAQCWACGRDARMVKFRQPDGTIVWSFKSPYESFGEYVPEPETPPMLPPGATPLHDRPWEKKMTPSEYQKLARRTASDKAIDDMHFGLVNWALGVAGEAGEVLALVETIAPTGILPDEKTRLDGLLTKEVGDVLWYSALFCEQCGLDLGDFPDAMLVIEVNRDPAVAMTVASCNLADYVKKVVCHGHDLDIERIRPLVAQVYAYATVLCARYDLAIADVMEANIEKLRRRYPEGWSSERSKNRAPGDT